jgi:hypothetical protein
MKGAAMQHRCRAALATLGVVVFVAASLGQAAGQEPAPGARRPGEAARWTPPRTPDGQPDIQGVWTNYDSTPFETFSPTDKPNLYAGDPEGTGQGTGPGSFPVDVTGRKLAKRRSLVIDPPSGRVPVMAWAEEKRDHDLARITDSWEHFTTWERCITRGVPGGIFPASYNSGYRIMQAPGYIVIFYEMIHEARIIPLDGRPHVPSSIRLWNGDSRGRWDGNTLVVDITNYTSKGNIATNIATQRIRSLPQSEALHVVERFTPVDASTIQYEVTISDPKVYTAPWTVALSLTRDEQHPLYEYACHEGNYGLPNTLSAGRARDRAATRP